MNECILFLDETKPNNENPYLCIAGFIIAKDYYKNYLIKQINSLKQKYFLRTDIIFHFSDMKKQKNEFSIFNTKDLREGFWTEYINILSKATFENIGVYFDNDTMSQLYKNKKYRNYEICFLALLDNFIYYLKEKNLHGQICIESRTFKENAYLQQVFFEYMNNGSLSFTKEDINKYITSLNFIIKEDNCIGLQIADIIPSQLLRYKKGVSSDFYGLSNIISSKIFNKNTDFESIVGFKNLL